ncbi:MAG TPA: helix-turn-helix domain-containing protein [Chloroflexota bacterium]|nr:helix-turn-helix domain-containing protein [Chloroflexota bacterium]
MQEEYSPQRLGAFLRQAREARGWSIAQVEAATRIPRRHLEALESDDLAILPPPVFTRGLVRLYAKHLGLSQVEAEELLTKEARHETVGVMPTVSHRPSLGSERSPLLRVALFVLLLGLVGGLTYFVLPRYRLLVAASGELVGQASAAPSATSANPSPTAAPATATPSPPSPTPRPTSSPTPTAPPSPTFAPGAAATATAAAGIRGVTIEVRAAGRVWAQAEADGQVVFSGILQTSEKKTWKAERTLLLHVGNAGLVEVTHNGETLGKLGPAGEVVKREWTSAR